MFWAQQNYQTRWCPLKKILPSHRPKNLTIVPVYFRVRKEKREYGQGKGEAHKIQEMGGGVVGQGGRGK